MHRLLGLAWAIRRWWVTGSVKARARAKGARVELRIHRSAQISSSVKLVPLRGSSSRVEIGPGCAIEDNVVIYLRGGSFAMGPGASIRRGTVIDLVGELVLEGRNILSYGNVVHCAERIVFEELAATAEYVTVVDSVHRHGEPGVSFRADTVSSPIRIGRNVWLASKSTVLMGVTVGEEAVVAAHALVNRDVEPRTSVAGVPARVIGRR